MRSIREIPRSYFIFAVFIFLFCGLFVAVELTNNKLYTNDFRVYFDAVNDFFSGNDPYQKSYGLDTGYFKYSPFTLYLFSFFTWVPFWVGQIVHLCVLAFSLMASIPILLDLAHKTFGFQLKRKQTWIFYVSFLCIAIHLVREFHLGNINLVLLLLFTLGVRFIQDSNPLKTAIFWGLMCVLKPIMIIAFIPLVFWKKWKLIASLSVLGIFFFVFPAIHLGWSANMTLWTNWLRSISQHGEYIVSENSLTYLVSHHFGIVSEWIPSLVCLLVLIGVMLVVWHRKKDNPSLIVWSIVFTAFAPNFFVTDTQHFLLAVPLLAFLLFMLSQINRWMFWVFFFIGMLLFSFNSNDLLGRDLSDYLDAQGILGIGNLVFIVLFIVSYHHFRKQTNPIASLPIIEN